MFLKRIKRKIKKNVCIHAKAPFPFHNSPTILYLVLFSLTYRPEVWEKASEQLRTAKGKTFHRHNSRPSSQEMKLIKSRKLHLLTKQGPRHSVGSTEQEYCLYPWQGILATEFLETWDENVKTTVDWKQPVFLRQTKVLVRGWKWSARLGRDSFAPQALRVTLARFAPKNRFWENKTVCFAV